MGRWPSPVAGCLAGSDGATALQNELALAPVLPGAVEVFSSPTWALDDDFRDMVIDVNRWWTPRRTMDGAIAYLQSHPPDRMVAGGIGAVRAAGRDACVGHLQRCLSAQPRRVGHGVR